MSRPDGAGREGFFDTLRGALGSERAGAPRDPGAEAADHAAVRARAAAALERASEFAGPLLDELEHTADGAGWTVARLASLVEASGYVEALAGELGALSAVRTRHDVLERMCVEEALSSAGAEVAVMDTSGSAGAEREHERSAMRDAAIHADLGVTGVDYAIAETGSCVLLAGAGVSRLAALLPPVHVAVVERGQVLPSLDELFTLRRHAHVEGRRLGYMNIVTGPSRSADIEQTIVKGVHGPGNVHMLLVDPA